MMDSILVAVHPGYARNRGHVSDRYGNYDDYLSRLRDAVWSQSSMIFLYRTDIPPFELPENAEVVHDFDRNTGRGVNARRLISRLKDRGINSVGVGGEFLWDYYYFGMRIDEKNRKAYESLSEEEKREFVNRLVRLSKENDLDPIPVLNALTGKSVKKRCVRFIYDVLSGNFHTELRRDLSYPTIEPQQFSLENIVNLSIEGIGANS